MNDQPPNNQPAVRRLEAALAKASRSVGEPVSLVIQIRRLGRLGGTEAARTLDAFITSFERVFRKEIVFLRSGTDRALPFDGVILPERPNTIFLDSDGHGNVLALLAQHSQMTKVCGHADGELFCR
jgi:hypothetical protein